jgi:hypothetical protein
MREDEVGVEQLLGWLPIPPPSRAELTKATRKTETLTVTWWTGGDTRTLDLLIRTWESLFAAPAFAGAAADYRLTCHERAAMAYCWRAVSTGAAGDLARAAAHLTIVIEQDPPWPDDLLYHRGIYHYSAAAICGDQGEVEQAVAILRGLVDRLRQLPGMYMLADWTFVTKAEWDSWVPAHPEDSRWFPPDPFKKPPAVDPHEIKNDVFLPVFKNKTDAPRVFQCHLARALWKGPATLALKKDPVTPAGRTAAVKNYLQSLDRFKSTHPFPEYVRLGYQTMDDFMDGWDWQFDYDTKTQLLSYNPIRDEYAVVQPITKVVPSENREVLMMNFYQNAPPPTRFKGRFPIELLVITDPFFFTQY